MKGQPLDIKLVFFFAVAAAVTGLIALAFGHWNQFFLDLGFVVFVSSILHVRRRRLGDQL